MNEERKAMIDGLRELATFLETHPDVPTPMSTSFAIFATVPERFHEISAAMGGFRNKNAYGDWYWHERKFGPLRLEVNIPREKVCERIVTGKTVVPATPEREVETVEWRCS